jgi:hypothetical protein
MMRYFFILILLSCTGCYTNYKVLDYGNGVRSNQSFKTTFSVCKIDSILSFDERGVPKDFFLGKSYSIEFRDNISNPRKILFFKKEKKYYWKSNNVEINKIPNDFAKQGWYLIIGLKIGGFDSASFDLIFYHLVENRKLQEYYTSSFDVNIR